MLIRVGEVLDNPVTGERGIVRVAPEESNGYLLVGDLYVRPGGAVSGEHVHPALSEAFTVVSGEVGVRVAGRESLARAGDRAEVAAGQAHHWWNAGHDEARLVIEVQPAERFVPMIRQLFGLARAGRTTAGGMPRLLDGVAMGREFADTMRFTSPPWMVQRVMFALLGPIARITGHRGITPDYQRAPAAYADLDPLPPEIVARIPALAGTHPGACT